MDVISALNKFTISELKILFYIQFSGGMKCISQKELGKVFNFDPSYVGKILRNLEKDGILEYYRTPLITDGGTIKSTLTITLDNKYVH
jgi:DNA-binding MarR family transcriptional regulator